MGKLAIGTNFGKYSFTITKQKLEKKKIICMTIHYNDTIINKPALYRITSPNIKLLFHR